MSAMEHRVYFKDCCFNYAYYFDTLGYYFVILSSSDCVGDIHRGAK
jgi:hypothetical protein